MQRLFAGIIAAIFATLVAAGPVSAQETEEHPDATANPPVMKDMSPAERRAVWETLTEEQKLIVRERRREARQRQRAEWETMTPEQRAERLAELKERASELTPEQRQALRERRQATQRRRAQGAGTAPATEDADSAAPDEPPDN